MDTILEYFVKLYTNYISQHIPAYGRQSWTWIGFIHGLDWIGSGFSGSFMDWIGLYPI